MNKKMVWIAGAVLILVLLVLGMIVGVRYSRQQNLKTMELKSEGGSESLEQPGVAQLIAVVQSEEEAQELADLYGITLSRVTGTLAIFETTEDPRSIIKKGKENGWKALALDDMYYINESQSN